jgi:hypothetical protein
MLKTCHAITLRVSVEREGEIEREGERERGRMSEANAF